MNEYTEYTKEKTLSVIDDFVLNKKKPDYKTLANVCQNLMSKKVQVSMDRFQIFVKPRYENVLTFFSDELVMVMECMLKCCSDDMRLNNKKINLDELFNITEALCRAHRKNEDIMKDEDKICSFVGGSSFVSFFEFIYKNIDSIEFDEELIRNILDSHIAIKGSRFSIKDWIKRCSDSGFYQGIVQCILEILEILEKKGITEYRKGLIDSITLDTDTEINEETRIWEQTENQVESMDNFEIQATKKPENKVELESKVELLAKSAPELKMQTVDSDFRIQSTKKAEDEVELEKRKKDAPKLEIHAVESNFRIQSTKKAEDEVELEKRKKDAPKLEIQKIKSNFEIKAKDTLLERLKVLLYSIFVRPFVKLYFYLSKLLRKTDVKITEPIVVNRNQNISENIKKISELNHFGSTGSTPKIENQNKITQNK